MIRLLKTIRLSKREKILLIIFTFIFILWLSYILLLKPQAIKIESLEMKKTLLDNELININHILEDEIENREELSNVNSDIRNIGNRYFPSLDQAQIIYYLEDIFLGNHLNIKNLTFGEKEVSDIDDLQVNSISILIPFEGTYDDIKTTVKDLNSGPFKLKIESLTIEFLNVENLQGEISLRIYCLENIIDIPQNNIVLRPRESLENFKDFSPFEENEEEDVSTFNDSVSEKSHHRELSENTINQDEKIGESKDYKNDINRYIIDNFNNIKYGFKGSHEMVKGNVNLINDNNKTSLSLSYQIQGSNQEENRAYIDLSKGNIEFRYPIKKLYLSIRSFNYSYGSLGIRLISPEDEEFDLIISDGISWIGWNEIEFSLPSILSAYPLKLTHIFYEITNNREDIGVLIFDKLEMQIDGQNTNTEIFDFYIVKENDSLKSISTEIYGSDKYVDEIINNNYLSSKDDISPGKILILKRR